ncbi:MAG: hypothetical protein DMG19_05850, partial [Acidobacteria bacterium]
MPNSRFVRTLAQLPVIWQTEYTGATFVRDPERRSGRRAEEIIHNEGEIVRFGSRHVAGSVLKTVAVCLFGVAVATGQAGQAQRPPMAEEVFKNVQILKGIPVDEFMDTMGMFAAATSLNCTSCHASDNTNTWDKFALDTPLKQTARRMMNMVSTINK